MTAISTRPKPMLPPELVEGLLDGPPYDGDDDLDEDPEAPARPAGQVLVLYQRTDDPPPAARPGRRDGS